MLRRCMSHSLAQGDQSRSQVLFLWTALRKLLACSFWGFWDSITSIAQVSIRWKVSNPLHSWHLITVKSNYSRTIVCAVHIFTSVAQCIGSILSWVSFRESSENLLAVIEFCIVLQYCCRTCCAANLCWGPSQANERGKSVGLRQSAWHNQLCMPLSTQKIC